MDAVEGPHWADVLGALCWLIVVLELDLLILVYVVRGVEAIA